MPLRRLSALVVAALSVEPPAVVAFPNPYTRFEVAKDAQDGCASSARRLFDRPHSVPRQRLL